MPAHYKVDHKWKARCQTQQTADVQSMLTP